MKLRWPGLVALALLAMPWPAATLAQEGAREPRALPPLPALRPAQPLSLADAVRQADQANRDLQVLRSALDAAAIRRRAAMAALLPGVDLALSYGLLAGATPGSARGGTEVLDRRELSAALQARLPLIHASRWVDLAVARAEQARSGLDLEQARQGLLYAVASTYFEAALLQRLLLVYRAQAEALSRHVEAAVERYRAGVGDLVDVKRAQTELVSVRESQIQALVALEGVRDALALLIASDRVPRPEDAPRLVRPAAPATGDALAQALATRWDLRLGQRDLALAEQRLRAEWWQLAPTLDASVQLAHVVPAPQPLGELARQQWTASLVLSLPLLDATRVPALQSRELAVRQARLRLEAQRAEAAIELERARRAVDEAQQLIDTAELKAQLADDALELAQANYVNGLGSALTVVDAQRSSQTAHVDLEKRRFELELARLGLARVLGTDLRELL